MNNLNEILEQHALWIKDSSQGKKADLREADLQWANLQWANLQWADLRGADLRGANLQWANLRGANLRGANLQWANLQDMKINYNTQGYFIQCPEEGEFIGYKKTQNKIIKLLILKDSKRSSATSSKCRASKVKVLEIDNGNLNEIPSDYDKSFIYEVGKILEVSNFDKNRWNECSNGIHFFMNRQCAETY